MLAESLTDALRSADVDAVDGAEWGKPSADRVAQRNGYRHRDLDTRVGTIDVQIPEWLLARRKRAASAPKRR